MMFGIPFLPHLGGSAAFHYVIDFFVQVAHRIQCARARYFNHETAPLAFRAGQLDERRVTAQALPRFARKILDLVDTDSAHDRNAFAFHEEIVGRLQPLKFTEPGALVSGGFMPVRLENVVHVCLSSMIGRRFSFRPTGFHGTVLSSRPPRRATRWQASCRPTLRSLRRRTGARETSGIQKHTARPRQECRRARTGWPRPPPTPSPRLACFADMTPLRRSLDSVACAMPWTTPFPVATRNPAPKGRA